MLTFSPRVVGVPKVIAELKITIEQKMMAVMDAVGAETITYLQTDLPGRSPPHKSNPPAGPFKPGGWRSITDELAESYGYEVGPIKNGVRLTLRNTADFAIYLEFRDGFFVLRGVTDPGGPVPEALIKACAKVAPEFKVLRAEFSKIGKGRR